MNEKLVETIAKELARLTDDDWQNWAPEARAALRAMTEGEVLAEMVDCALNKLPGYDNKILARNILSHCLRAALGDDT